MPSCLGAFVLKALWRRFCCLGIRDFRLAAIRHRKAGFTFVEIILAVLITGLVMTSLYALLVGTVRVKELVETEMDEVKAGSLAFDLVRRDLQAACALRDGTFFFQSAAGEGGTFGSGAGRVDFVAAVKNRFPDDSALDAPGGEDEEAISATCDLCEIGYRVVTDGEERVLIRREDFYVDDDLGKGGVSMKLLRGVKVFALRFYRGDEEASGEDPAEEWDGEKEKALPFAVHVKLVLSRGKEGMDDEEKEKVFEAVIPLLCGTRPPAGEEETGR